MDKELLQSQLKTCDDKDFFEILEKCIEFRVPIQLQKVLTLNLCNNSLAFRTDIFQSINEIELFMRTTFDKAMIKANETVEDYLGIFSKRQQKFQFLCGQRKMLVAIHEFCHKLYADNNRASDQSVTVQSNEHASSQSKHTDLHSESSDLAMTYQSVATSSTSSTVISQSIATVQNTNEDRIVMIKKMYDELYRLIKREVCLQEALPSVSFDISPMKFKEQDDGSKCYSIKCPFEPCQRECVLHFKSYSSYYTHKSGTKKDHKSSNMRRPKWNFSPIMGHIKRNHSKNEKESISPDRYSINNDDKNADDVNVVSSDEEEINAVPTSTADTFNEDRGTVENVPKKHRAIDVKGRYPLRNKK